MVFVNFLFFQPVFGNLAQICSVFWHDAILESDIQLPQICPKMWTFVKNIGKGYFYNMLIINNIRSNPFRPIPLADVARHLTKLPVRLISTTYAMCLLIVPFI